MDAYIYIIYYLLYLSCEDDSEKYEKLATKYFHDSYKKFSHNAEYLFFVSFAVGVIPWFFGSTLLQTDQMRQEAKKVEPNHIIYGLDTTTMNQEQLYNYAKTILDPKSSIQQFLKSKGFPGEVVLKSNIGWAQIKVLES